MDNRTIHRPLQAVPPRKNIFVSRLTYDTSSEDVDYYIRSKIGQNIDIFIQKFSFSTFRSVSSFNISTSHDYFNLLWTPILANTLVREYVYRENITTNRIGVHPRQEQNKSKTKFHFNWFIIINLPKCSRIKNKIIKFIFSKSRLQL